MIKDDLQQDKTNLFNPFVTQYKSTEKAIVAHK